MKQKELNAKKNKKIQDEMRKKEQQFHEKQKRKRKTGGLLGAAHDSTHNINEITEESDSSKSITLEESKATPNRKNALVDDSPIRGLSPSVILALEPNPTHKKIQTRNMQSIEYFMEDCRSHLDHIDYLQQSGKAHLYKG